MDDKTKEIIGKVEDAIDKAMDDFMASNESVLFNNDRDTRIYKYGIEDKLKKWKKKKTCIVINCNKKSIEKSHTIQKSASIKRISENGHVLTPSFNKKNGNMKMEYVGINEASTFPGFCSEHERLFEDFENIKDLRTEEHIGLQLYRTICREIVVNEFHTESICLIIEKYKSFRNEKVKEAVLSVLGEDFLNTPNLSMGELKVKSNDKRIRLANDKANILNDYLTNFLYKIHDAILNDIKKKKFQKTTYKLISVDKEIPMALAGRGNFSIKTNSKIKSIDVIINVLPLEDKTLIILATLKKNTKLLDKYVRQFSNPFEILNLIESWMIHGSDHWFIKPSVWEQIENIHQQVILDEILDDRHNIGHEFKLSIFNELRNELVQLMEQNYPQLDNLNKLFLLKEKNKLTQKT